MKKTLEIIKPTRTSLADLLRELEVGQEAFVSIDEYKVNAVRQAAFRLKKEGIVFKVTERGYRDRTHVQRIA